MKKALFILAAALLTLCGCNKDENFDLGTEAASGSNCMVEELVLNDSLRATIDVAKRLIKVKVPVDFTAKRDMVVSKLAISNGAQCDIKQGQHLNLDAPQVVTVKNGDLLLKYKLAVINDEAKVYNFLLEGKKGIINQDDKTITVSISVNEGINLSSAMFEAVVSEDAVCSPASGTTGDFNEPFELTVKDNTAVSVYTVYVTLVTDPVAIIVGNGADVESLDNIEEKVAARSFTSIIPNSMYVSFDDLVSGNVPLTKCRLIYFHRHCASYANYNDFKDTETKAMNALQAVRDFWKNGGGIFLSRSAVNYAIAIGAMPEDAYPNNVWGGSGGEGADLMGDDPWHFFPADANHPLWANLKKGPDANGIYTVDPGYTICNTTSQYGFWDAYQDGNAAVEAKTGGRVLGGSGNCCAWELKAFNGNFGHGGVICIGSGLFDWNSPTPYTSNLHDNMSQIMLNALEYIGKE